jgi:hypothetical protein
MSSARYNLQLDPINDKQRANLAQLTGNLFAHAFITGQADANLSKCLTDLDIYCINKQIDMPQIKLLADGSFSLECGTPAKAKELAATLNQGINNTFQDRGPSVLFMLHLFFQNTGNHAVAKTLLTQHDVFLQQIVVPDAFIDFSSEISAEQFIQKFTGISPQLRSADGQVLMVTGILTENQLTSLQSVFESLEMPHDLFSSYSSSVDPEHKRLGAIKMRLNQWLISKRSSRMTVTVEDYSDDIYQIGYSMNKGAYALFPLASTQYQKALCIHLGSWSDKEEIEADYKKHQTNCDYQSVVLENITEATEFFDTSSRYAVQRAFLREYKNNDHLIIINAHGDEKDGILTDLKHQFNVSPETLANFLITSCPAATQIKIKNLACYGGSSAFSKRVFEEIKRRYKEHQIETLTIIGSDAAARVGRKIDLLRVEDNVAAGRTAFTFQLDRQPLQSSAAASFSSSFSYSLLQEVARKKIQEALKKHAEKSSQSASVSFPKNTA